MDIPRLARIVLPGLPYHVTHRGNRRQNIFFRPQDRQTYKRWLGEYAERYGLEAWSYCLMTNHVHLLVVGHASDSLAAAIGRTHGRFAQWQNKRNDWSGHLWANRFYSTPLDDEHPSRSQPRPRTAPPEARPQAGEIGAGAQVIGACPLFLP